MLENRSFDQMLGCMKKHYPMLEGIDLTGHPRSNPVSFNRDAPVYYQKPTRNRTISPDPGHDLINVLGQIADGGPCNGFVMDYHHMYPNATASQLQDIMGYYEEGFLPALHTLARTYAICDHWFSSLPGPTWPNRFFVHSGTSLGHVGMPEGDFDLNLHNYDQDTIYDRLNEKTITWKIYFGDVPQSLYLSHQMLPENTTRYSPMEDFWEDMKKPESQFPQYVFIEPSYFTPDANSQHSPHDILKGDILLAKVYNALISNPTLWESSVFVLLYDEHGGFYDHVMPPRTVPPDNHLEEFTFDKLGVRVPALLISPWIDNKVISTVFDHTSLLKYLIEKWNLNPLTERVTQAHSFRDELTKRSNPRTDAPKPLPTHQQFQEVVLDKLNEAEQALLAFSLLLESKSGEAANVVAERAHKILQGVEAQVEVAKERLESFFVKHRGTT